MASNEWYTPPHIFHALDLRFDLDPCAPRGGVDWIPAERHYSVHDDGLSQPWEGRVWLNPPYGPHTAKWLGRLVEHGDGIALVFARTDTRWCQAAMRAAETICFVDKRLRFINGKDYLTQQNADSPSLLLAYGNACSEALLNSGLGMTVDRVEGVAGAA